MVLGGCFLENRHPFRPGFEGWMQRFHGFADEAGRLIGHEIMIYALCGQSSEAVGLIARFSKA